MSLPIAGAPAQPSGDALTPELQEELDTLVKGNDLVLFMKGTPDQPQCGFSARAAQALGQADHEFQAVNVFDQDDPARFVHALAQWAQFPTLPQVWVKGELIGGSDIAAEMVENGELQSMLQE